MKLAIERSSRSELVFTVHDVDQAVVNALRRVIIAEVPYVAVAEDTVVFAENTCVLHNDFLSSRLALAPIHLSRAEADAYIPGSIKIYLDVRNDGKRPLDVTTSDIRVTLHDQPHPDEARLYPPCPVSGGHVLIAVLKPGEAIRCEATVAKGHGHASFAVASKVAFSPLLDDAIVAERLRQVDADDARAANRFEHIDRKRCWAPGPDGNPRAFRFTVESECGMTATDIVQSAVEVLQRKCATARATVLSTSNGIATLEVAGEGHTLGNLLQSGAMDELVGEGEDDALRFVGYFCPHPLEKRVVFRVVSSDAMAAFEAMKGVSSRRREELGHALSEEVARVAAG
jgi:DNA-directed RNA polymerase subunit L